MKKAKRDVRDPYEVQLEDVVWWSDITPREYFTQAYNQARRVLSTKTIKEEHYVKFRSEYKMLWNFDNTFDIIKR